MASAAGACLLIVVDALSFLLRKRRAFLFGLTQAEVSVTLVVCFDEDEETSAREEELRKIYLQTETMLTFNDTATQVLAVRNTAELSSALRDSFSRDQASF